METSTTAIGLRGGERIPVQNISWHFVAVLFLVCDSIEQELKMKVCSKPQLTHRGSLEHVCPWFFSAIDSNAVANTSALLSELFVGHCHDSFHCHSVCLN